MIEKIPENSEIRQKTNQDYIVDSNAASIQAEPTKESPVEEPTSEEIFENALEKVDFSKEISNSKESFECFELKYLQKDDSRLYPQIDKEVFEEIKSHQAYFEPIFLKLLDKYSDSEELSDVDKNRPFCFSPRTLEVISNKVIIPIAKELEEVLGDVDSDQGREYSWKETHISGILGKLLAFESFRMSRIMATRAREHIEKYFNEENTIRVKEYCTGAGINTALLYMSLERTGKEIQIHTVDNAIQSVACSAGFLSSIGIPVRIVLNSSSKEFNFNGVTIYFDTAMHFSQKKSESKYHMIVTDSGLNYLPENSTILKKSPENLLDNGLIHICTLDPKTEIDLSKLRMLSTIAFGNHPEIYRKHKDNIYDIKRGKRKKENGTTEDLVSVKQMFSASTSLQYNILQILFKEDRSLFWDYLNGAKAAAALTKALSPKIKIDLRESGRVLKQLYPTAQLEYIPSYEKEDISLTRILELNTAKQNVEL